MKPRVLPVLAVLLVAMAGIAEKKVRDFIYPIVVVSASNRRLMRIDTKGDVTTIFAGAPFEFPIAVAAHPDGSCIVADGYAKALFKVTPEGKISTILKGDPFQHPDGLAIEPNGSMVVADPHAKSLYRVSPNGTVSLLHKAE